MDCVNASKVSAFDFFHSTNISRLRFHPSTSMSGSNDPTGTSQKVSAWLRGAGTHPVRHFIILRLFVVDTLDLDLYRFNLDSSGSTAQSIDLQATPRRVSAWLSGLGTSLVSGFAFSSWIGADMLDLEVYRSDLDGNTSTLGSNDPMGTFAVVCGWLCDVRGL